MGWSEAIAILALLLLLLIAYIIITTPHLFQQLFTVETLKNATRNLVTMSPIRMPGAEEIHIVVLIDNNAFAEGLETAWGLSIYVEVDGTRILFDTGPDPGVLERNSKRLGIDLSRIDVVVISHGHGDHTGGLVYIASVKPGVKVFIPPDTWLYSYVKGLGLTPVIVNKTMEVARNVFVVQPLYGPPLEEALAINTSRGIILLVGCSHPGVVNLAKQAVKDVGGKIFIVIGGFHMWGSPEFEVRQVVEELIGLGAEKIYPIHCSGSEVREYLKQHYPERYGDGGVGLEINLEI
jgi:7,8-dihydropterin-6-yl-methyl-4-(beta-D-ribofuranosyl)aminobenzene 5'-phosphate synthase